MSETRLKTKKQLRRILSMAFSLDAAMDEFLADKVEEDREGNFDLKDEHDEDAFITVGRLHEQIQEITYDLHTMILQNYEYGKEGEDE